MVKKDVNENVELTQESEESMKDFLEKKKIYIFNFVLIFPLKIVILI